MDISLLYIFLNFEPSECVNYSKKEFKKIRKEKSLLFSPPNKEKPMEDFLLASLLESQLTANSLPMLCLWLWELLGQGPGRCAWHLVLDTLPRV